MNMMVIVLPLFISAFIAQGITLRHYFVRQNKLNNKMSGETPSKVLYLESQLGPGILCAQDGTCASLTHLEGQCLLYNSSVSKSYVQAQGARTFGKQDLQLCPAGRAPVKGSDGTDLYCGLGSLGNCPVHSFCNVDPVDRFAVCCPI